MNEVVIRKCRLDDLSAVRDLLGQLSEVAHAESSFDLGRMTDMMHQMDAAPDFYLNLVAETGGRVSGFISLIFYQTFFHRGGTCLINELVVDREVRGSGIGRLLIERAVAEARRAGHGRNRGGHRARQSGRAGVLPEVRV